MRVSIRLAWLAVVIATALVALLWFQRRTHELVSRDLAAVEASQAHIQSLMDLDSAFDRQLEQIQQTRPAAPVSPDRVRAVRDEAHRALATLQAHARVSLHPDDAARFERLAAIQAMLESDASDVDTTNTVELDDILRAQVAHEHTRLTSAAAALSKRSRSMTLLSLVVVALLISGIVLGLVVPLRRHFAKLIKTTRRIAGGDLETALSTAGPGDLNDLGRAIEAMRIQLSEQLVALRTSEERHRALFDRSPVPTWVFDLATLEICDANDAMTSLYGYSREEVVQLTVLDMVARDERDDVKRAIASFGGGIIYVGVSRNLCKDGREIVVDVTAQPINIDGRMYIQLVTIDVTKAQKVEEQLRQAQKLEAIGHLAGGVAHDFNNVLAAIQLNGELVAMTLGADHEAIGEVAEISAAAQRGARLTRQLLAFSRKEAVQRKPLAINAVISELQKMLQRVIGEDIEVVTSLASRLPAIEADAGQLEQVLINLVVNARDAMPSGGLIAIETSLVQLDADEAMTVGLAPGAYVRLTVTDSGTGMDEATQKHIFEPFFTTKQVGKGTGLGLANVFGIVAQSRGAIAVDSELGAGSTFRLYFPCSADAPRVSSPDLSTIANASGERLLVVEDDEQVRSSICRILAASGYQCFEARNGDTALDFLQHTREPIDLLLTDLVMPGIDGRSLAKYAAKLRPGLPVLLMSGYTQHAAVKTAGSEPYLHKPFTAAALTVAVREALATAPMIRERPTVDLKPFRTTRASC